jgi:L-iditol 2-dehydrogenase
VVIGLAKLAPGPGHVGLAERPERDPDAGEVLVEVLRAGICGTDLHIEAAEFACAPPVTMGHEVCGVVRQVGAGVDSAWVGARIVAETYFSTCGTCAMCRDGRGNLCRERRSIGSFVDGAFAPQVVLPAANLHAAPPALSDEASTLIEPLACICNCLCDPPVVSPGDRVLVTGPGPVGLLTAQLVRAHGASVVVSGLPSDTARLATAERLGLATTTEPETGWADVVVECSGAGGGAVSCLDAARRGGRYVQVGVFGKPVTVPLDRLLEKELVVSSGFASTPRSWLRALAVVETGALDLEALISDVVPLERWEESFAALRRGEASKIVFDPRST